MLLGPHLLQRLRNSPPPTTNTSPKLYLHCTSMDGEGVGVYLVKVRRGRWRLPEAQSRTNMPDTETTQIPVTNSGRHEWI